jgi:hypothetical protein
MTGTRHFTSAEYPVVYSVMNAPPAMIGGTGLLSLAVLVQGIPSFLATVPVAQHRMEEILQSLDAGPVRVSVQGISVELDEVAGAEMAETDGDPWSQHWSGDGGSMEEDTLPGAYLMLVCADQRRLGVARIVSRESQASPEEVARYVLRQIQSGVQVPDLASTS